MTKRKLGIIILISLIFITNLWSAVNALNDNPITDTEKQQLILNMVNNHRDDEGNEWPTEVILAMIFREGGAGAFHTSGSYYAYNNYIYGAWTEPDNTRLYPGQGYVFFSDGIIQVTPDSGFAGRSGYGYQDPYFHDGDKFGGYKNNQEGYEAGIDDGIAYLDNNYATYQGHINAIIHYNTGPRTIWIYKNRRGDPQYLDHIANQLSAAVPDMYGLSNPVWVDALRRGQQIVDKMLNGLPEGKDIAYYKPYQKVLDRQLRVVLPIIKGLYYLRDQQNPDGSWSNSVGITSMAALAFLNAGYTEDDPTVNKAIQYILANQNADRSFGRETYDTASEYNLTNRSADRSFGGGTYDTSLAVLALIATHNSEYNDEIEDAANWLKDSQWDEDCLWESVEKDNWRYGGFGYGSHSRPDLSNTQFALMALDAAPSISKDNLLWDKAQVFLARVQNRQKNVHIPNLDYTVEWNPSYNKYDDGGFVYHPGSSLAGNMKSYGSMTGAGIWCLRLSNVGKKDPRMETALDWVINNYMWDGNPGMSNPGSGQYYYYLSMSKALTMTEPDFIGEHDWYQDLSIILMTLQNEEEWYWINERDSLFWEDNEDLVTSYAILSLQTLAGLPEDIQKLSYLTFILWSNADLHVYDPFGRHVGENYETGGIDLEIPNATYTRNGAQNITISGLDTGNYRVVLMGTGAGEYTLNVTGGVGNETVSKDSYTETISEGEVQDSTVNVAMITWLTIHVEKPEPTLVTDLPNVRLLSMDPTVEKINVSNLSLSVINETYKPSGIIPQSAYMVNSTGAGSFTLRFTDILDASAIIVYKINATNQWIEMLDTTTTANTVTFTMEVGDPPVVFGSSELPSVEQPQYYCGTSTIQGKGNFTIDESIQDWATAIDTTEHIEGTGEFAMDSKKVLNQAANTSDFYDPNFYYKKTMQFQGNATNRLISREKFESSSIFGGTGTRINEFFDVSRIQKDESGSIKTISAPGSGQSHRFATMHDFSGIWGIHSDWQKICQKEISHRQLFKGNFSVQKDLIFEREIAIP